MKEKEKEKTKPETDLHKRANTTTPTRHTQKIKNTTDAGRKIILPKKEHSTIRTMRKTLLSLWTKEDRKRYRREASPLPQTHKSNPNHAPWKTLLSPEKAKEITHHKRPTRAYCHAQTKLTHNRWKILLSLSKKERKGHYDHTQPSPHTKQHLSQRSTITHSPPSPLYWNVCIDHSEVVDSTKGYPGEGPPTEKQNKHIKAVHTERTEAKTFDSTKGYPGKGPGTRRGKKNPTYINAPTAQRQHDTHKK